MSLLKIAIVGPESTGKSLLTQQLAAHFKTAWVPEMARPYLSNLGRNYTYNDLSEIARLQLAEENKLQPKTKRFLFCDTNLLVIKVWSDYKYKKTEPWILNALDNGNYFLHLLCDIDLPWEYDPLREHPNSRKELFDIYENELIKSEVAYAIVKGEGLQRLTNAIALINSHNTA